MENPLRDLTDSAQLEMEIDRVRAHPYLPDTVIGAGPVYYNLFMARGDIEREFECTLPAGAEILFAWYEDENYTGRAIVVYRIGTQLYEVHGSHCSCHGLEEQWEPEETTLAAMAGYRIGQEDWDDPTLAPAWDAMIARLQEEETTHDV